MEGDYESRESAMREGMHVAKGERYISEQMNSKRRYLGSLCGGKSSKYICLATREVRGRLGWLPICMNGLRERCIICMRS